jgi:uncharacterized protein
MVKAEDMLIVDSHIHLGASRVTESVYTEAHLLATQEKWGVDVSVVLPLPYAVPSQEAVHDRIYHLSQEHPGKFFGVVELSPSLEDEPYWKEAERCFTQLGFVAVKLHTYLQPVNPLSTFANKVFEVAKHFKVPVIVHTGLGVPFAMPSLLIPRAKEYPDVPIILSHAGNNIYTAEAIIAAQLCDNIILEPSWCSNTRVKEMVKKIGSDRVMMASDGPANVPVELTIFKTIDLTDAQLEDCLGRTAVRVLKLPIK